MKIKYFMKYFKEGVLKYLKTFQSEIFHRTSLVIGRQSESSLIRGFDNLVLTLTLLKACLTYNDRQINGSSVMYR